MTPFLPVPRGIPSSPAEREVKARPMCGVCGRPVDRFVEIEHFGRLRFIARCHGECEVVDLDADQVAGVQFGTAFAVRMLGP